MERQQVSLIRTDNLAACAKGSISDCSRFVIHGSEFGRNREDSICKGTKRSLELLSADTYSRQCSIKNSPQS